MNEQKGFEIAKTEVAKEEVAKKIGCIVAQLENDFPGVNEGLATAIGATAGAGGSYIALTLLGTAGLSAAGITSGLATAGSIIGGGMVAGIGVLAAPIAALALAGYIIARKIRSAKLAASLNEALGKLYDIQSRLIKNAKYFRDELAQIKTLIDFYEKKGGKLTQ